MHAGSNGEKSCVDPAVISGGQDEDRDFALPTHPRTGRNRSILRTVDSTSSSACQAPATRVHRSTRACRGAVGCAALWLDQSGLGLCSLRGEYGAVGGETTCGGEMLTIQMLATAAILCSPLASALSSDVDGDRLTQPEHGATGTCAASSGNSYHPHTKPMEDPRISRLLGKQRRGERETKTDNSIVKPLNGTNPQYLPCSPLLNLVSQPGC